MKNELMINTKNQINFNGFSYVAHLAASGNDKLVNKRIEESPGTVDQAIYGYAISAHITQMEKLISECPDKTKAMKMAVRGLVRGNYLDELYKLKDYKAYKADIVFGYAQAGNQDMVAMLVNKDPSLFESAVHGYALTGRSKPLLDLIKGTRFYGDAIYQAAKAGHVELVNQLLAEVGFTAQMVLTPSTNSTEEIRLLGFLNKALSGYCKGYHLEHASNLLIKGANIQAALDELKIAGKLSLAAYMGLFIVTPELKSKSLFDQIQRELSLLDEVSLSSDQVENLKKLNKEYFSKEGLTWVAFLSDSSEAESDGFEVIDKFFGSWRLRVELYNITP